MPRVDAHLQVVPSVLDRLLDDAPGSSHEPLPNRFQNLRQLKHGITRDLEALLNTRRELLEELPAEFTEVNRTLLNYGLPDFTSYSLASERDRSRIRRALEQAIAIFEPRLDRVRVTLDAPNQHDGALHFRIEAVLPVDPAPELMTFDAALRLHTQEYQVHGQE